MGEYTYLYENFGGGCYSIIAYLSLGPIKTMTPKTNSFEHCQMIQRMFLLVEAGKSSPKGHFINHMNCVENIATSIESTI